MRLFSGRMRWEMHAIWLMWPHVWHNMQRDCVTICHSHQNGEGVTGWKPRTVKGASGLTHLLTFGRRSRITMCPVKKKPTWRRHVAVNTAHVRLDWAAAAAVGGSTQPWGVLRVSRVVLCCLFPVWKSCPSVFLHSPGAASAWNRWGRQGLKRMHVKVVWRYQEFCSF